MCILQKFYFCDCKCDRFRLEKGQLLIPILRCTVSIVNVFIVHCKKYSHWFSFTLRIIWDYPVDVMRAQTSQVQPSWAQTSKAPVILEPSPDPVFVWLFGDGVKLKQLKTDKCDILVDEVSLQPDPYVLRESSLISSQILITWSPVNRGEQNTHKTNHSERPSDT